MRTSVDALRSLQKYVAELVPDYEVRMWDEKDTMLAPFARVTALQNTTYEGNALWVDVTQQMIVQAVPVAGASVEEALLSGAELEGLFYQGFRVGVGAGRPARIPLYDFDGIPLGETSERRHPNDFMRLVDFATRVAVDPDDDRRVAVVAELRVSYRRMARVHSGQIVKRVQTQYDHPA